MKLFLAILLAFIIVIFFITIYNVMDIPAKESEVYLMYSLIGIEIAIGFLFVGVCILDKNKSEK